MRRNRLETAGYAVTAVPSLLMSLFSYPAHYVPFAVVAAAVFVISLAGIRTAGFALNLSALLLFAYGQRFSLPDVAGDILIFVLISASAIVPACGNVTPVSEAADRIITRLILQLSGSFLAALLAALAVVIIAEQLGFSINSIALLVPFLGGALLALLFLAGRIERDSERG
ncbi:MAG: hypothetical protein KIY12_07920 [Thermoplasmata archaeon]|uniref:Uncharacterized protein n=1 Tax=Candidatus Sysuiplasma superficiale TaxID=2823368 RepID=A0A8J7YXE1_9ARCH|nr:hypothetical protein [Candidatus Sysuiplasma superficiale]MBX8644629.1 hypothetical protein [Candidatus Sysuiplasma superficiale]MCL4346889.1 hypothetical protein [Candidatus Thermoplasmatota archaeon]